MHCSKDVLVQDSLQAPLTTSNKHKWWNSSIFPRRVNRGSLKKRVVAMAKLEGYVKEKVCEAGQEAKLEVKSGGEMEKKTGFSAGNTRYCLSN